MTSHVMPCSSLIQHSYRAAAFSACFSSSLEERSPIMATPTLDVPPSPAAPIRSPETDTAAAPRRMIDIVLTAGGLLMTVVLIIAGGLLV